jgi:hypothetical protein
VDIPSGKSFPFCQFWEELPNFVAKVDWFQATLSNLYNLENSSQKPLLGRDFSCRETFPRKKRFPGKGFLCPGSLSKEENLSQGPVTFPWQKIPRKPFPGTDLSAHEIFPRQRCICPGTFPGK